MHFPESVKIIVIVALAWCLTSGLALALMPPHLTGSQPPDNGTLDKPEILIFGYTLGMVDLENMKVTDAADGQQVKTSANLDCEWEGTGNMPGARQQRCTVKITLEKACPGHTYEVFFLDQTFHFTYDGPAQNCP